MAKETEKPFCLPKSKVEGYLEKYERFTRAGIIEALNGRRMDHLLIGIQLTLRDVLVDLGLSRRLRMINDRLGSEARQLGATILIDKLS